MIKKDNINLTIAIIVTVFTGFVFLGLFIFLGINHRKDVFQDSKQIAKEISRKAAIETENYLNSALWIARSMKNSSLIVHEMGGTRSQIKQILEDGLLSDSNFLATWTLWEPNAFDNRDSYYSKDLMYNKEGTLGVAFFNFNNKKYTEVMTSGDYNNYYYSKPKELRKELIINPYWFRYSGYHQLFYGTTVSVPIIKNNEFLGVVGVDIDLKNLQEKLNKIRLYKTGYLSLIANNGKIVTHHDTLMVNKKIEEVFKNNDPLLLNSIHNGEELTLETISEFTGEKVFRFFYPIKVGDESCFWSMMVEIPVKEATYRSIQLFYIAVVILIIGLSLLLYLIKNISDRKSYIKTILEAKARIEASDKLKTAFLNNISHEIRTPLNGILGFSELLIESEPGDKQIKEYKEIIHNSSNQLLSIISNVIELSKIQTNQVEKIIKEFDLYNLVSNVTRDSLTEIKGKSLTLIQKFPEKNHSSLVYSDEDKIKQVLKYLLNNAIKFTHSGYIEVGYSINSYDCLIYVKDSGIGIKPEYIENIFKYFNQEDSSMNRNYGGLGMGLSISKSYIDLLGGKIWFESTVGAGTTFFFTIPRK